MRKSAEVIDYIKNTSKSYSQLIKDVDRKFNTKIGKSLISYYKRKKPRIVPVYFENSEKWELEWLKGLYFADGCKFKESFRHYTIKFALDSKRDQDITRRLVNILKKMGLHLMFFNLKNVLIIKIRSKVLYNFLPNKKKIYYPKNFYAFISGLIDGDGCTTKNAVIISQHRHKKLMNYLTSKLGLHYHNYKTKIRFGVNHKITYYVPVKICKKLIKSKFCVKLNRNNKDF